MSAFFRDWTHLTPMIWAQAASPSGILNIFFHLPPGNHTLLGYHHPTSVGWSFSVLFAASSLAFWHLNIWVFQGSRGGDAQHKYVLRGWSQAPQTFRTSKRSKSTLGQEEELVGLCEDEALLIDRCMPSFSGEKSGMWPYGLNYPE